MQRPEVQIYITKDQKGIAGLCVLRVYSFFGKVIDTVCIREDRRDHGLGTAFIRHCEHIISIDFSKSFIGVFYYNRGAQRLYERLGYERLMKFPGHSKQEPAMYIYQKVLNHL